MMHGKMLQELRSVYIFFHKIARGRVTSADMTKNRRFEFILPASRIIGILCTRSISSAYLFRYSNTGLFIRTLILKAIRRPHNDVTQNSNKIKRPL